MPPVPDLDDTTRRACPICGTDMVRAGTVEGRYAQRRYMLARCPGCGFACVADPSLNFSEIYDDRYYAGEGADPLVDYRFEFEHPDITIRSYEWEGVRRVVDHLRGHTGTRARWLDYGCGNGCLVRHLRESQAADAFGFDEGSIAATARAAGLPVLSADELAAHEESFDVVTAIEVIEHTMDPVAELRRMRRLLRPGGLLFLTTGNAQPHAKRLDRWSYVIPEIHISLFEPRTLERALATAGFHPEHRALGPGFNDVLKFKLLKNLRIRRRSALTDALPSGLVGPLADRLAHLSDHPIGWAS